MASYVPMMALQINFIQDVAAKCGERLAEAGYTPPAADADSVIRTYLSVRHRRVRPQVRRVHKAAYTVPPERDAGEKLLLAKVEAGEDLWPHQSRFIKDLDIEDGMLNDYGIQHFHLGTTPDKRHANLIQGTKELLFAIVKDHDFYVIGIYDHSSWAKKDLLEVINSNWPQISADSTLKDGPGMKVLGLKIHYNDEEAAFLRKRGVNALRQLSDGSIQIGSGGGVASDGSSIRVTRQKDRFFDHVEELQQEVTATLDSEIKDGKLPPDASIRLVWEGDLTYAVSDPVSIRCNLGDRLQIPPL